MFQAWEKEYGILFSPSIHFTGGEAFLYTSLRIFDHRDLAKHAVERFWGWIEKTALIADFKFPAPSFACLRQEKDAKGRRCYLPPLEKGDRGGFYGDSSDFFDF